MFCTYTVYIYTYTYWQGQRTDWETTDPTSRQRGRPHRQDCNFHKIKNKQIAGHMPQMGYDTKTDRLTEWLSVGMWLWLCLAIDKDHSDQYQTSLDQLLLVTSPAATTSTRQQNSYVSRDRRPVPMSEDLHSRPPQHTGNPTQRSSADYPLAARRTSPVAVRAAQGNLPYTLRPFSDEREREVAK
jgi:hypothetical protein